MESIDGTVNDGYGTVYVADSAIPHLHRFTHAREATTLLRTALASTQPGTAPSRTAALDVRAVTVLRSHPGSRWTLRYDVRWGGADRTIIAKVYVRDRSDVAATLRTLRRSGFGAGERTQVPALLAYVPALHVLLQDEAPGDTVRAAMQRGQIEGAERTARWLAAFYVARLALPAAYTLHAPLTKARQWTQQVCADAPVLAKQARHVLAALTERQPAWPPPVPHLVHGDFSAAHVYLTAGTTTVIDWDSCSVGDGAEDAGKFLASLHHLAARKFVPHDTVAQATTLFTQTYRAAAPRAAEHVAFYEALQCLRTAKRLAAHRTPHHLHHARVLLAAGAHALR